MNGKIIANKYVLIEELNRGSFSSIFYGVNKINNKEVAIKFEFNPTFSTIKHEVSILKYLINNKIKNIPHVYWFGPFDEKLCLIMTKYDCSLSEYINNKNISLSKIKSIIIQLTQLIKNIHDAFLVHRDIKPQNIMIHKGELCLIDFAFSVFYIDENKKHIIDNKDQDSMVGSPRFMSYFIYEGYKSFRRDDLISMAYICLLLFCKELPWDNLPYENSQQLSIYNTRNQTAKNLKSLENIKRYCSNKNVELQHLFNYLYNLSYFDDPNYLFIIDVIKNYDD
tara:strand:+ start:6584 stop:7426 length:843 start_codon:yes stop_codon:yes gene_type:complete